MAFKDILVVLTSYPWPTPPSAIEDAVDIAATLGSRISALVCEVKISTPGTILGNPLLDEPGLVEEEARKSADNSRDLLAAFEACAQKAGNLQDKIYQKCPLASTSKVFADYARLYDLTIVPVPYGELHDHQSAESVIFGSGRPTIIISHSRQRTNPIKFDTVVVAWDFSRAAARAIWDAVPILESAQRTFVLTVASERRHDRDRSATELAKHLARHGVQVILDQLDGEERPIGEILESHVAMRQADLLVMGAYGHSRIREFILGGATRSMLSRPAAPIFLSH